MKIIDTHQHLWDLQRFPYSWCASIPALNRSFLLEDYRDAIAGTGIAGLEVVGTVFVEADVDEPHSLAEARWINELSIDSSGFIAGMVAAGRPEREGFAEHLEQLSELPAVRGVRRVLHTMPDETAESPLFVENVRRLADYNYSFDLCVQARQLPKALALVRACPETQFILDHSGNPTPGQPLDQWQADLAEIAACPNIVCKLSGFIVNGDSENRSVDSLRPCVDSVLEAFGPDRLLWGSDWPVCILAASLQQWLDAAQQLTAGLDETARAKIFAENAKRVYRLA